MRGRTRAFLWLLCGCLCLCGCAQHSSPLTRTSFLLDTTVTVTLYEGDTSLLDGCMEQIAWYEALFSRTVKGSDVDRINHAAGEPVTVSQETADLLRLALEVAALTDGALDITVAPLVELWGFGEDPAVPDRAAVEQALGRVGYERVELADNTVRLPAGMGVDLGAVAKGYIADRLREYLLANGCHSAVIDLGGNILTVGDKRGKPFTIGIADPQETGQMLCTIPVQDGAAVTSGSYQRYFEQDGKRYHHILDPHTGFPAESGLLSVTVLCGEAARADALSTACFVLGADRGWELIESLPGVEALFVREDGTQRRTSGFPAE